MKFLVLCILLGTSLALVQKRQDGLDFTNEHTVIYRPEPNCRTVCERQAPNDDANDDDTIQVRASRYRRNINANIIEIREAPAKAIAIGLPAPLLNFGDERLLRDEFNEKRPLAEQNETKYTKSAIMEEN